MVLSIFLFSGAVSASTINVNPGKNSIQNAISSANSGDTLNLSAGTYNQHDINVNKNLTITGPKTTGTPTAIIDGQNQGRVFNITSGVKVTINYLTIQNGNATKDTANPLGGGIYNNYGTCTLNKCDLNQNIAENGGGIYNSGTCTVMYSNINTNTASKNGGGIMNDENGVCTVKYSNINGNTATNYGGGLCNYLGTYKIIGSSINSNAAIYGGGIGNYDGYCTVTVSNVNSNTAKSGGGIMNDGFGTCIVTDSNVNTNTASNDGGGICIASGTCKLINSNLMNNSANAGGGINNGGTCEVSMTNLSGNIATRSGGGICNFNNCTVIGCDFELNKATISGNAVYNEGGDASSRKINFNRFNNPKNSEIYSYSGSVDAQYNWWGSNIDPNSKINGTVDIDPWIIIKVNAKPNIIGKGVKSYITADLTYDHDNNYHNPANGHIPNGINIKFTTTLGMINSAASTASGIAKATLTGGSISGIADVYGLLDEQITKTNVIIETIPPKVISTNPSNKKTGFSRTGTIVVKFSENIYISTYYSKITVKNLTTGKNTTISKSISKNILSIKNTSKRSANTWYQVTIPAGAVKDKSGNKLATYIFKFKTGG